MLTYLRELCSLDGVSGDEAPVREYIRAKLEAIEHVDIIKEDALGNLLVHLKGQTSAEKTVMIAAHMDEVGMIVTGYTEDGLLRFSTVGGISKAVMIGRTVRIRDMFGVIGCKAIHMCKGDEKTTLPSADLLIDIGACNKEEAACRVSIGDSVVFDTEFAQMGELVRGRAIDDRAGCAVLLKLAQTQPKTGMWLAFTVQEEIGLRGAKTAAFQVDPSVAVVVDATTAADTCGVPKAKQVCAVNHGAVVSFMDGRTLYDKALYERIMETAQTCGIPAQPKSMVAGGNDAGAIQTAAHGAKVAAISLPCRYIHSPSCVLSMQDMDAVYQLITALIERSVL